MTTFNLKAPFKPQGDQPQAIKQLSENLKNNRQFQTLLGVTGSGKTFTIANVIQKFNKPTLIISHNKTLAGQLYQEFREFFPDNSVNYFISYYDYYQPEAYIPQKDLYIEKDASINQEIEKLRLATTAALLARKDVIVVASVSAIYNIGSPYAYRNQAKFLNVNDKISVLGISRMLVNLLYERNDFDLQRGKFRIRGNNVEVYLAYADVVLRILTNGMQIIGFELLDPVSLNKLDNLDYAIEIVVKKDKGSIFQIALYPAKHYIIPPDTVESAINRILEDMEKRVKYFEKQGRVLEANRIKQKVLYDVQMIQEVGYCKGIENYSVYFDGRNPGDPPYSLLDYFPEDYLLIIDESHMTIPQLRAMYNGDYARKKVLVDYGFRLPTAFDNRPLKFNEFETRMGYTIFMSATPGDYEITKSTQSAGKKGIVEQLIRPTGIVDPEIEIRKAQNQINDLVKEIKQVVKTKNRVLVITLTKKMAENLADYLTEQNINVKYLHSDIKTLERTNILAGLRAGDFDVLIGINLLREGLDLPEVKLVAILDADKQGFLRSTTSLIQIMGRAARHVNGYVILYADTITPAIKQAIDEVNRRRKLQIAYNKKHNIVPKTVKKKLRSSILPSHEQNMQDIQDVLLNKTLNTLKSDKSNKQTTQDLEDLLQGSLIALKPLISAYKVAGKTKKRSILNELRKYMKNFAQDMEFEKAIVIREIIKKLKES